MFARKVAAREAQSEKTAKARGERSSEDSVAKRETEETFVPTKFPWSLRNVALFHPAHGGRPHRGGAGKPRGMRFRGSLPLLMQAKLEAGAEEDPLEREAAAVAAQVMRMPDSAEKVSPNTSDAFPKVHEITPAASVHAPNHRKCDCGGTCDKCKAEPSGDEHGTVQRKRAVPKISRASSPMAAGMEAPPVVHEVLRSLGHPLDQPTRAFFEPRFGYDFSRVRVHTDAEAAESARAVNARAYTVGNRIAFAADRYSPHTSEGRRLLAHELTHSIQQSNAQAAVGPAPIAVGEQNAEQLSAQSSVRPGSIPRTSGIALQRQVAPTSGPQPEVEFTVFVAPEKRRKDKQYALNEARKDAARIEKAGTLSTEDRRLINAKLRFFDGAAWETYSREIKPALERVTQPDKRRREYESEMAFYTSERQSQQDFSKERRERFRATVGSMTPEQIYKNWKEGGEGFASAAQSPTNTLSPEQFHQIYIRYWGDKYSQGSAQALRIAREAADKDFGEYVQKITHYYAGEIDALGPEFHKAKGDIAAGEAALRQSVYVMEYLRAAAAMGKHVTLKEVSQLAITEDYLEEPLRQSGQFLGAISSPESFGLTSAEEEAGLTYAEEKAAVDAMAEEKEAEIASTETTAPQAQKPAPAEQPAAPPPKAPVGFKLPHQEGAKPAPAPPAPKRPSGFWPANVKAPTPANPESPPPLSRPVEGFGRKPEPRPTTPRDPHGYDTNMPPARVMPSSTGGKQPLGPKPMTGERPGTPARASGSGKVPEGEEPHSGAIASSKGGGNAKEVQTQRNKSKFGQGEIAEDIAEKTGKVQIGETALEETGIQPRYLARIYEHHHALVQQLRRWFKAQGVNIDEFTIKLSADEHRWIHNEYKWNALWKAFRRHNPKATPAMIKAQMQTLLKEFGLEGLPIVDYPT